MNRLLIYGLVSFIAALAKVFENQMRMLSASLLLTLATLGINPDAEAARLDWERLGRGHYAYATVSNQRSPEAKERLAGQLAFVCASLSSKSHLADQLPQQLPGTDVYRLDLTGLGWERHWQGVLLKHYPYRPDVIPHKYPLLVRADWIVAELSDPVKTKEAAALLLYGKQLKTGKEFVSFWGAKGANGEAFGFIEGTSGVQAEGLQRLMVNHDTDRRTRLFQTFDSKIVAGKFDPIEHPILGTAKYDGSEIIAGIPKSYAGEGGALQAYFLANGQDKAVDVAPVDLVKDSIGLRGPDIRNVIDCMSCHATGMQHPTVNAYRAYILGGAKIFADKATKRELERVYESPFVKELLRQDEDYAIAVRLVNGLSPEKNCANFQAVIKAYDGPVDLAQAARELYTTPDELRLAIGGYAPSLKLSARIAALAEGMPMSRDQFKASVPQLICDILPAWRGK